MVLIVVLALMAIAAFFYFFIHKELLPLRTLEASAKQMIKGDYFAPVTTNNRQDEVGILTNSFVAMRRSIRNHLNKIDRNREKLDEQNKALNEAHQHVKEADRVKTAFLQNMTDQMSEPVLEITKIVNDVREHLDVMEHEQIVKLADQMDGHTNTITALLDRMLEVATKEEKEEESE
jgi:HAMP domain-containing protein